MEKTYIGFVKTKNLKTKDGGEFEVQTISISPEDFQKMSAKRNEKGWLNLDMIKRREVSDKGSTHYITINEYKKPDETVDHITKVSIADLPF